MSNYYLSRREYDAFIKERILGKNNDLGDLSNIIEQCELFEKQMFGYNYFLSKIFEVLMKRGIDCTELIKTIYSLPAHMFFNIEEHSNEFIDKLMLQHHPNNRERIKEDLSLCLVEEDKELLMKELSMALEDDLLEVYS